MVIGQICNVWPVFHPVIFDEVVKRPSMAFLLQGKRKARFSLFLQINDLRCKPLVCAPIHGRSDDFLRSHHFCVSIVLMKLPKLALIIVLALLSAYMVSTWLGFDDRMAAYGLSHEKELRASAEKGDAKAQFRLALTYSRGLGIKENDSEALKWYQRAADQGYARAQYNLGMMYYFGKGVPRDNVIGYKWVILAADRGQPTAKEAMIALAKKIPGKQIAEARAAAQVWSQAHNE